MPDRAMEMGSVLVGKCFGEKAALMKPSLPPLAADDMELKRSTAREAGSDMMTKLLSNLCG